MLRFDGIKPVCCLATAMGQSLPRVLPLHGWQLSPLSRGSSAGGGAERALWRAGSRSCADSKRVTREGFDPLRVFDQMDLRTGLAQG